ncbi:MULTISPECIES: HtaA domain-containing protein [Rhodococcus erythropolis group]|uniref:HtaA domain-containing protein n=1 Tax=Rhodococcus erythropolis group TaxID=2840174 RepID=UPI001BEA6844|nr:MULTISPECIES: HtaA domain-containing protein [Rhodococcus erythropolis group]MBT2266053.1 HtaA domain-containing protein [Rhodococcus erythropolis]MBT2276237.1 HtaA domain-containing protein [Rhodococcus qingshengii]
MTDKETGEASESDHLDTGLVWGVRESFVQYILSMPDGRIILGRNCAPTDTGKFAFPYLERRNSRSGMMRLQFGGSVEFFAHFGMLSVTFSNPMLEIDADGGTLSVEADGRSVLIASVELPEMTYFGGMAIWKEAGVSLTDHGSALFGGTYPPGTPLDPLSLCIPA